jgi:hypothetical protein
MSKSSVAEPWNSDELPNRWGKPWILVLVGALAGGAGWGIRGQYGHESGASMAALHVALVLGMWLSSIVPPLRLLRALGMAVAAAGYGGCMTYGQTLGLTQDAALVGNWDAWRWGMTGVFLKGGLWIAFFGLFLGIGLSRKNYLTADIAVMAVLSVFVLFIGVAMFNEPFDPSQKKLPAIYFSDSWIWEPDAELSPRRERWGGLLLILIFWLSWCVAEKRDLLPLRFAIAGFIAGGSGFFLGQCLQSWNAWTPGFLSFFKPGINWWNFMETTFGFIWGGGMAFAVWLWRYHIHTGQDPEINSTAGSGREPSPSLLLEWTSAIVMASAFMVWNLGSFTYFDRFADLAWTMIIVPLVMIHRGRVWPWFYLAVVVMLPIAGKTVREMAYRSEPVSEPVAWIVAGVTPLLLASLVFTVVHLSDSDSPSVSLAFRQSMAVAAVVLSWTFHALNFIFFEEPWPWASWTSRTPNEIVFLIAAVAITMMAVHTFRQLPGAEASRQAGK